MSTKDSQKKNMKQQVTRSRILSPREGRNGIGASKQDKQEQKTQYKVGYPDIPSPCLFPKAKRPATPLHEGKRKRKMNKKKWTCEIVQYKKMGQFVSSLPRSVPFLPRMLGMLCALR